MISHLYLDRTPGRNARSVTEEIARDSLRVRSFRMVRIRISDPISLGSW